MNIEFLTHEDRIRALIPAWRTLHEQHSKSLFTHPEWIMCWWEFLGKPSGCRLFIAVVKKGEELAGLAPLVISRRKGLRILEWAGADVFDYCDSIAVEEADAVALWQAIHASKAYDIAMIKDVRPEASSQGALKKIGRESKHTGTQFITNHWKNSQEWLSWLGYDKRKKYKQRISQLEKQGEIQFDVYENSTFPEGALERLIELKRAWYESVSKSGVFTDPNILPFFQRLSKIAAAQGKLHFSTLSANGAVIASHLGFVHQGSFYYYTTAYDAKWGKYSPGQVLMWKLIFWSIDNQLKEFDLMRGEEVYKSFFTDESLKLSEFSFSRGFKGKIGEWYYHWK